MSDEHPFKRLSHGYHERDAARAEEQYEAGRVSYLLSKFKVPKLERQLRDKNRRETGADNLTFDVFNNEFPTFPVLLGARKFRKLHLDESCLPPGLSKNFSNATFVRAYEEFLEVKSRLADGRLVGLVFPRKGVPSGWIIYQAEEVQVLPWAPGEYVQMYAGCGPKKGRHFILVRSFDKLIDAIHAGGHGWKPEQ